MENGRRTLEKPRPLVNVKSRMESPTTPLTADALRFALYNRFLKGEARVPQMPEALLRVRRLLEDPRTSLERLCRAINADPPLAAWLMQYADSPLLRGVRPCTSLRDVLARLGTRRLQSLVLSFSLRNLFIGTDALFQRVFRARWQAALECAACCAALAECSGVADAADALLAGLLQDVGSLPLLAELQRWPERPRDEQGLHDLCEQLSGSVGVVVMTVWKLPTVMIECARYRLDRQRQHPGPADLTDLLQVARLLQEESPATDDLPAYRRLLAACPTLPADPAVLRESLDGAITRWRLLLGSRC
ncbi:HDOD domain protein [compost metagenome]|uniref:HD-like signal output (HDOD) domain, no enzymatic activity n=2 Tax=Pseudomonas jinjuensis TaxID=198616 RepID=A0A1H0FLU5_9PSED|nr:HD-like signal output (HDOD) domain, no enzymatic activity [Pseudomonas jinjuensis]